MSKRVTIPFNDWSLERLRDGRKTATTRSKKFGNVGDTFEVENVIYEITQVGKFELKTIAESFYKEEGAESEEEFIEEWNHIHPRKGFVEYDQKWLHLFRRVT